MLPKRNDVFYALLYPINPTHVTKETMPTLRVAVRWGDCPAPEHVVDTHSVFTGCCLHGFDPTLLMITGLPPRTDVMLGFSLSFHVYI